MFLNDHTNRGIIKEISEEYGLSLVDPEIFLSFINDDFYIKTWNDVYREMQAKNTGYFSMSTLKQQYKLCGVYLYGRGYTEFDRSKI